MEPDPFLCYYCSLPSDSFKLLVNHQLDCHPDEIFKVKKKLKLCEKDGTIGYVTLNYSFRPVDCILDGKTILYEEPDKVIIKDASFSTPSPVSMKRTRASFYQI